jgi:tripartite-type tricarboxylate transporter receptor subunit TctC
MKKQTRRFIDTLAAAMTGAACLLAAACAHAQSFPEQRVTLVVPYGAGGVTDVIARLLAQNMEGVWKQAMVVENRPGAGSMVGNAYVARAKPDGYTLLFNGNSVYTAKIFTKDVPYDSADLKPLVQLVSTSYLMVTTPETQVKTLPDMIALMKARPRQINYGTVPFSSLDLDYAIFQQRAGVEMTGVPFNGAVPLVSALLRNDVQFAITVPASVMAQVADGKLVPLAVTGARRDPRLPNVPATRELGYAVDAGFGFGVIIPSKAPENIAAKIGGDIAPIVLSAAFGSRMRELGYEVPAQPLRWAEGMQAETNAYVDIAQRMGVKPQ